jgi:hypothetical protein
MGQSYLTISVEEFGSSSKASGHGFYLVLPVMITTAYFAFSGRNSQPIRWNIEGEFA